MPLGLCECGCGQATRLCTHTSTARGVVKGQSMRFISGHNKQEYPIVCKRGHALIRGVKCAACAAERTTKRRATPEGKAERALEHLKRRAELSEAELLRAKGLLLEFFRRPATEQVCPICGDNCSGKKRMAADHCHETSRFRAVICQACNVALGAARERDDLLGTGKLGVYLQQHRVPKENAYAVGQS